MLAPTIASFLLDAQPAAPTNDVFLWALGILASLIGALMLIILNLVLKQGGDTNSKVTTQGVTLARVEQSVATLDGRVSDLHAWKNQQQEKELQRAVDELEEERRARRALGPANVGTFDRRSGS